MNLKQHRFVTEYLRHRDAMTAYSIAYNYETSNYASLQSAANRLMNHPEVSAAIHSILDGIRHDVEQEIRAELKVEVLTIQRKREILAKIAAGEFYAVHNYKGKDCNMCTQHVWPTINQVLKAIDLDNKMAGHYSVDKRQQTVDKEKTLKTEECPPQAGGAAGRGWNTREGQQHSETVSLRPVNKTSITQQNTTTPLHDNVPLGGEVEQTTTNDVPRRRGCPQDGGGTLAKDNNSQQKALLGVGVEQTTTNDVPRRRGCPQDGGGRLAKDNNSQQKAPLGVGVEQTTTNAYNSPPCEGGENYEQRIAVCNSGEVNHSRMIQNTNNSQQITTKKPAPLERVG